MSSTSQREDDIKANPELGGGLGGEIAGMKKDTEKAQSLTGDSGDDVVDPRKSESLGAARRA